MLGELLKLFLLLTTQQRIRLVRLQFLVLLMAIAEVAGVVSIGPFMALVGDIDQLQGQGFLADLYRRSGLDEPRYFLAAIGMFVLFMLGIATSISIWTTWRFAMYGNQIGAELSSRLFEHYMHKSWLYHANSSSSELTNRIMQECGRVTQNIVIPFLKLNAKLFLAVAMAMTIIWLDPVVALIGITVFFLAYLLLYRTVRKKLIVNGVAISEAQRSRFKILNNSFGGVVDVLLLGRQRVFVDRFRVSSNTLATALGVNSVLAQVPGYVMELVAFGSVILLTIYLLVVHDGSLGAMLPILSIYALAGFKMLPSFQQVYSGLTQIRSNLVAFHSISEELVATSVSTQKTGDTLKCRRDGKMSPNIKVQMSEVGLTYPGRSLPALTDVSIEIPARGTVGLVGASGSGKSTAIHILLGLLQPDTGRVTVDGISISRENLDLWQNTIGFVPQQVFLSEVSIRENVAFGIEPNNIDDELVERALELANLRKTVAALPDGIKTHVGERGVQLSGGQQQRIGIARALYHDPDVLVFDEATSSLDGLSEQAIMEAIHGFSGNKTIVMIAHRLSTVRQCEVIYFFENGRVQDSGTFSDLVARNSAFREMAEYA